MKVIKGLKNIGPGIDGSVVTIGVFDGVHIGHRKIIEKVVSSARKADLASVVMTFDPHPIKVMKPGHSIPSLISLKHRIRLIEELGADILIVAEFSRSFSSLAPERFVKDILVDKLRMKHIFTGENFYFGRGRGGRSGILRKLARSYGFRVTTVAQVMALGHIVSSSLIRRLILRGDLARAARLLGRPVAVLGTVVKGSGIARGLGCPTANINPHHEAIPPRGVYAVRARIGRRLVNGILNIGFRPTFYGPRDEEPTVELHIFGFNGDLYNRDIEVYFVKKIRSERKFRSAAALVEQIKNDMKSARALLSS